MEISDNQEDRVWSFRLQILHAFPYRLNEKVRRKSCH